MMELRFVERTVPAPEIGRDLVRIVKKLQFCERVTFFKDGVAMVEPMLDWKDVPFVTPEDE